MRVVPLVLFAMLPVCAAEDAAIGVHADFEGGSIGKVERVSATHLRCAVAGEADHDGRNRQASWYYFRLDHVRGREITLDLVNLVGEYNYQPGTHAVTRSTRPVYSYDDREWRFVEEVTWDEREPMLRLRLKPDRDRVWIAHVAPYTNRHFQALMESFSGNAWLKQESAGRTVGGREMPLLTITNAAVPDSGKKVVWLMARQHAWESGTSWIAEGALRFLLSSDTAAARLRNGFIVKMFPLADPDGVARGGVRFNANGYDLNRNWDAVDPRTMPEIAAQRKAILDWVDSGHRLDLFLTLHNQEKSDSLGGPFEAGGPAFQQVADRLLRFLRASSDFYCPGGPQRFRHDHHSRT